MQNRDLSELSRYPELFTFQLKHEQHWDYKKLDKLFRYHRRVYASVFPLSILIR